MAARSSRQVAGWLALLAVVAGSSAPADPPAAPSPRRVKVSVVVILASEKDDKVERKLEDISREVRKMHPRLKGFRLGPLAAQALAVGEEGSFRLVEEQRASVTVQRAVDKNGRVRITISPPQMGEITYSTPCGKFLPIVTPFRTRANELLILAVRVQPCNREE